jgi:hypothetical protein
MRVMVVAMVVMVVVMAIRKRQQCMSFFLLSVNTFASTCMSAEVRGGHRLQMEVSAKGHAREQSARPPLQRQSQREGEGEGGEGGRQGGGGGNEAVDRVLGVWVQVHAAEATPALVTAAAAAAAAAADTWGGEVLVVLMRGDDCARTRQQMMRQRDRGVSRTPPPLRRPLEACARMNGCAGSATGDRSDGDYCVIGGRGR